ncbi:MAG: flagellar biosynthesis anti-sigma factor FlgM [Sphingorhabdus sp.]
MIDRIPPLKAVSALAQASTRTLASADGNHGKAAAPESSASLSKLISLARTLADQGPPIDTAKIAQVRQAIADGSYQIDVEALANAMLRDSGKV